MRCRFFSFSVSVKSSGPLSNLMLGCESFWLQKSPLLWVVSAAHQWKHQIAWSSRMLLGNKIASVENIPLCSNQLFVLQEDKPGGHHSKSTSCGSSEAQRIIWYQLFVGCSVEETRGLVAYCFIPWRWQNFFYFFFFKGDEKTNQML